MQAANFIKAKHDVDKDSQKAKVRTHRSMAKPVLVASITQDNSANATLIEENEDGIGWVTTRLKLPNGKNAWNKDTKKSVKRRISTKNKVEDEAINRINREALAGKYKQTGVVNIVLYVGFLMIGLGMILTFIGAGERGFKTQELKLIGPSLIGCGIFFALLRILFCSFSCKTKQKPLDEKSLLSPSTETLLDNGETTGGTVEPLLPKIERFQKAPLPTHRIEVKSSDAHNERTAHQLLEEEVESDVDLGVMAVKSPGRLDEPSSSRRSSGSQDSQIPKLPSITRTTSEVLLDPRQLDLR